MSKADAIRLATLGLRSHCQTLSVTSPELKELTAAARPPRDGGWHIVLSLSVVTAVIYTEFPGDGCAN
jgi:hypothetical protein